MTYMYGNVTVKYTTWKRVTPLIRRTKITTYGNVVVKYTTWKKSNTPNYEHQDNDRWECRREIYDLEKE